MLIQRIAASPRDIAEQMVAAGSILTLPGSPLQRVLVGDLRWADGEGALYFPAFGNAVSDAALLRFDSMQVHPVGVCFMRDGDIRAFLAPIEKAAVEDPDDYRVAWTLWREVRLIQQRLVDDAFAHAAAKSQSNDLASGHTTWPSPAFEGTIATG